MTRKKLMILLSTLLTLALLTQCFIVPALATSTPTELVPDDEGGGQEEEWECKALMGNHVWDDMGFDPAPDCENGGVHVYQCYCLEEKHVPVPATGHTKVTDAAVPPTCTEGGKTEGKHCSVCGEIIVAQQDVPAGHTEVVDAAVSPPPAPRTARPKASTALSAAKSSWRSRMFQQVIPRSLMQQSVPHLHRERQDRGQALLCLR